MNYEIVDSNPFPHDTDPAPDQVFGKLQVIKVVMVQTPRQKVRGVHCKCLECNNTTTVLKGNLIAGRSTRCRACGLAAAVEATKVYCDGTVINGCEILSRKKGKLRCVTCQHEFVRKHLNSKIACPKCREPSVNTGGNIYKLTGLPCHQVEKLLNVSRTRVCQLAKTHPDRLQERVRLAQQVGTPAAPFVAISSFPTVPKGTRKNKWTVVSYLYNDNGDVNGYVCQCECGTTREVVKSIFENHMTQWCNKCRGPSTQGVKKTSTKFTRLYGMTVQELSKFLHLAVTTVYELHKNERLADRIAEEKARKAARTSNAK